MNDLSPDVKRTLFPLRAPRNRAIAMFPVVFVALAVSRRIAAAVNGYYEAFFSVLIPPGRK